MDEVIKEEITSEDEDSKPIVEVYLEEKCIKQEKGSDDEAIINEENLFLAEAIKVEDPLNLYNEESSLGILSGKSELDEADNESRSPSSRVKSVESVVPTPVEKQHRTGAPLRHARVARQTNFNMAKKKLSDPKKIFEILDVIEVQSSDDSEIGDNLEENLQDCSSDDSMADPDYQPILADVAEEETVEEIQRTEERVDDPRKQKESATSKKSKNKASQPVSNAAASRPSSNKEAEFKAVVLPMSDKPTVQGKNGFLWNTAPPQPARKTKAINIHIRPGPTSVAREATKPIDCFNLFFSTGMIEKILIETNNEIALKRAKYKDPNRASLADVSLPELRALFGLLYLAAALRSNHLTSTLLFDPSYSGDRFCATMSEQRFEFLLSCLRLDNKETREERKKTDKLFLVSEIWNLLLANCKAYYKPGSYLTIDEQLVPFRGRCPFKMYIPSKPDKYGIEIIMMCDNATKYFIDGIPFTGKGTVTEGDSIAFTFVKKLIKCVRGSNRNITTGNWITSVPLAQSLLKEDELTMVGSIRQNKPELPIGFVDKKFQNRKPNSSVFLFNEDLTAVSYKPSQKKLVTLISTLHDNSVCEISQKPEIVLVYNRTKGAVDTFDQLRQNMNCARKTKRWSVAFLYNMLNIAAVNAFVIFTHNHCAKGNNPKPRLDFMLTLHKELTKDWQTQRLRDNPRLPQNVETVLANIVDNDAVPGGATYASALSSRREDRKRKYCSYCPYQKRRYTTTYCVTCDKPICAEHQKKTCGGC